ncbi:uncharacterized protein MYCGRDRAFT_102887 [Zymoseptoria tritici IPO323]|uniref:Uncharacterized protein n=1 Tax=Zymoseptoria tritici (strain CBS 115943 / IPO323) TaxID=336722 RepID=F9WYL5_ZYMTI|nr:uncharacterized protein MYCGRDRAFT_102887 [Zymoseptoria tritici IPO323]EGP91699.1 hypothetical protein MYCGRDRAFT_102887 [Zymoseptoria tritici IPO323]
MLKCLQIQKGHASCLDYRVLVPIEIRADTGNCSVPIRMNLKVRVTLHGRMDFQH